MTGTNGRRRMSHFLVVLVVFANIEHDSRSVINLFLAEIHIVQWWHNQHVSGMMITYQRVDLLRIRAIALS
jgi:hypothetical protein